MNISKTKKDKLDLAYNTVIQVCLYDMPLKELEPYLPDDSMNFGAGATEKTTSKEAFLKQIENQKKIASGLEMEFQITPVLRKITNEGNGAIYTDDIINTVWVNEVKNELKFRLSFIFEYVDKRWIMVHSHTSAPDSQRNEDEVWPVEELKRRTELLEKSLEEKIAELEIKNRELEIESAMERIRSKSLAMHKSEDLRGVVNVLFEQMQELSVEMGFGSVSIYIFNEGTRDLEQWLAMPNGVELLHIPYFDHPILSELFDAKVRGDEFFAKAFPKEIKNSWAEIGFEVTDYKNLPEEFKDSILKAPGYSLTMTLSENSGIAIPNFEGKLLSEKDNEILKRVGRVFEQSYIRFLDLQKAETQVREAQIEAALEKIRSRTMGMNNSNELLDVIKIVSHEMRQLGIRFNHVSFGVNDLQQDFKFWTAIGDGREPIEVNVPALDSPIHQNIRKAQKSGETFITDHLSTEVNDAWTDHLQKHTKNSFLSKEELEYIKGKEVNRSIVLFPNIFLILAKYSSIPFSEEDNQILKRTASVFEQTYTRFLDLKKAEAQTREAQIEAAVERVRAKALAMHNSTEILEVAVTLKREMVDLGLEGVTAATIYLKQDNGKLRLWDLTELVESEDGPYLSLDFEFGLDEIDPELFVNKIWNNKDEFYVVEMEYEGLERCIAFLQKFAPETVPDYKNFLTSNKVKHSWHPAVPIVQGRGRLNLDFILPPPKEVEIILPKMGSAFDLAYQRFEDLQNAEAQAREAKIEAALERVRAMMMAMHKSDELRQVIKSIFEQLQKLGFVAPACAVIIYDEKFAAEHWFSGYSQEIYPESYTIPYVEQFKYNTDLVDAFRNGVEYDSFTMEGQAKIDYGKWAIENTDFKNLPKEFLKHATSPDKLVLNDAFNKYGMLEVLGPDELSEENADILKRFSKVFEQTYTRFLDLQKVEGQAREAHIEAALEKVRSRSIGMQNSEELREVIQVIHDQFIHLGFEIDAAGFTLDYHQNNDWNTWIANKSESLPSLMFIPYIDHPQFNYYKSAKEKGLDFLANTLSFEDKNSIFTYMFGFMGDYPQAEKDELLSKPGLAISQAFLKNISLWIYNLDAIPYSEEVNSILMRFAKVFEQTYTRFLDLQRAEEQAREAQIEAALEKVRSRSLAMRDTDELREVVTVVAQNLQELGVILDPGGVVLCTYFPDNKNVMHWIASPEDIHSGNYLLTYFDHPILNAAWDSRLRGDEYFSEEFSVEDKNSFFQYAFENSDYKYFPDEYKEWILGTDQHALSFAWSKNAAILIPSHTGVLPTKSDQEIMKRFANVFEQAYVRFLDLQKTEKAARETQIELSLQKIRAQVTAMQESSDLFDIVVSMRNEFIALGHEADYFWHMRWSPDNYEMSMTSTDGNRLGMVITVPKFVHEQIESLHQWEKSSSPYFVLDLDAKGAWDYIEKMNTYGHYEQMDPDAPTEEDIHHLGGITFIIARTTHGEIGFSLAGQVPDPPKESIETLVRFAGVFDLAYRRFEDLKEKEAQRREAEIELALEKTRAQSMMMQRSDELNKTSAVFHEQLKGLGIDSEFSYLWLPDEENMEHLFWATWQEEKEGKLIFGNKQVVYPLDKTEPSIAECYVAWESGQLVHINPVAPGGVKEYFETWSELLDGVNKFIPKNYPDGLFYVDAYMKYGCFGIMIKDKISEEGQTILQRFSKEFERAYTRFLDLVKAEEQAREAQIELSLERIRALVTAMQESSELLDIVVKMRKEFVDLGHEAHYFWYMRWLPEIYEKAMTSGDGTRIGNVLKLPRKIHGQLKNIADWEKGSDPTVIHVMDSDAAIDYVHKMIEWGDFQKVDQNVPSDDDIRHIGGLTYVMARTSQGEIGYSLPGMVPSPPQEDLETLVRFAGVFDLAYRRFEDLKTTEHQRRETEIELALERIRARTMAMHKSDELADAAFVLFQQLKLLGVVHERINIGIVNEENNTIDFWVTEQGGKQINNQFSAIIDEPTTISKLYGAWKTGSKSKTVDLSGKALAKWLKYLKDDIGIPFDSSFNHERRIQTAFFFSQGMLVVTSPEPLSEEDLYLIEKFAGVFDLTYTRFNDLQIAEAQTHKANIEVALERVRARALAMQQPEELVEVVEVLRREMGLLGVEELETSSIYINKVNPVEAECWYSLKDVRVEEKKMVADHFDLNYKDTWVGRQMFDFYRSDVKEISIVMQGDNRIEWINYCSQQSPVFQGYYGDVIPDRTYHLCKFSNGSIGAATPGKISSESWDLLRRAASVFSLAYSRFQDLTKARSDLLQLKEEKKRAEDALSDLKAAQAQLIQAEKMASLGELTAGIAHEIQNPLNFVNNFSEVSSEIVEELQEELDAGDIEEAKEIVKDILQNLEKIHHHGQRASGIVKGMLDHSRAGSGEKVETDVNSLCDEYLRLAYHACLAGRQGFRARDKSFNAAFETSFDESLPKIKVVPQDIGRVLLNLINNAFQAVHEIKESRGESYTPKVSVSTTLLEDQIQISISDNGPGISDEIRDKIFQPFFTTKPTGQGTGLGLSLSYDIVKAHGGNIKVKTQVGKGTSFIISIPLNSQ